MKQPARDCQDTLGFQSTKWPSQQEWIFQHPKKYNIMQIKQFFKSTKIFHAQMLHSSNDLPLVSVLVFRCLNGLAPSYLSRDLQRVSELVARRRLRSSSTSTLVVPPTRLSTGDRAFPVAAAQTWNSLPTSLTSLSSLASFRRQLKTELFVWSFPDLDSSAYDRIWLTLCSHFASHSHFVTVLAF